MTRSRPKKEFKFSLYLDVREDIRLLEYVEYLRKTQQFPKMLRNALRLVWTLGEGDLSVLFELFPALRSQFMPKPDELIEQFRQMLLQRTTTAAVEPPPPSGPQQLELPLGLEPRQVLPPPVKVESMEQTIQEAVQAGIQQVMKQLAKMQPVTALTESHPPPQPKPMTKNGSAKSLATPQIAMPNFDEEDDMVVVRHNSNTGMDTNNFLDAAFGFQDRKDT